MDINSVYLFNRNLNYVPLISMFALYLILFLVPEQKHNHHHHHTHHKHGHDHKNEEVADTTGSKKLN